MTEQDKRVDEGVPDALSSLGARLRAARESRGLSVLDVATALKLTSRQVDAMESGRLDRLPGAAFARGFLRNYARMLGLDADQAVSGLGLEPANKNVRLAVLTNADGDLPGPAGSGRRSAMPLALMAFLLLGIAVVGWYFDWFRQPALTANGEQVQPLMPPADAPPAEGGAPGQAPVFVPAPVMPAPAVPTSSSVSPAAPPVAQPSAAVPLVPPNLVQPVAPVLPATAPAASAPAVVPPAAGAPSAQPVAGNSRLAFSFEGESWVEVRDAEGKVILSRHFQPGARHELDGRPPFKLVVGNASRVKLSRDGADVDLAPHTKVTVARLSLP